MPNKRICFILVWLGWVGLFGGWGGVFVLFYLPVPEELSWMMIQSYLSIGKITMVIAQKMDLRQDRPNRKRQEDLYERGYNIQGEVRGHCGGRILSKPPHP